MHYLDGFHEILAFGPPFPDHKKEHWVTQPWFFDLQLSHTFNKLPENKPTTIAADSKQVAGSASQTAAAVWPEWRGFLASTTLTVGVNNIFNHDPPRSVDNFSRFIYDPTGRFVYVSATKKFW